MRLTLRVRTYCNQPPIDAQHRQFDTFPVLLGRSSACDYCLDDASRYISSNHAVITLEGGQLIIQDTSANGVYINGSAEPVGQGRSQRLRHDDTLAIGDFTLVAAVESLSDAAPASQIPETGAAVASGPARAELPDSSSGYDPFRGNEPDWTPLSAHNDDPFAGDWTLNDNLESGPAHSEVSTDSDWADWPDETPSRTPDRPVARTAERPPVSDPLPAARLQAPSQPSPVRHSHTNPAENSSLRALYSAAGVREAELSQHSEAEILEQTGRLLAQMIDAMMVLLQSRTQLKNAIRSDVTTLSRSGNNPLKFSDSAADALTRMLAHNNDGYLPADLAVQEAVDDLKLHQLAMLDGMRSAVKAVLLQFDPERLASKLEKSGGFAANIPITREAKLWELFCEQYDTIRETAVSDFSKVYGAEFRKAYEKRIRKTGRTPDF